MPPGVIPPNSCSKMRVGRRSGRSPGLPSWFQWRVYCETDPVRNHMPTDFEPMRVGTPFGCSCFFTICSSDGPEASYSRFCGSPTNTTSPTLKCGSPEPKSCDCLSSRLVKMAILPANGW